VVATPSLIEPGRAAEFSHGHHEGGIKHAPLLEVGEPGGVTVEQVETLVKQLAERMESRPDDVQGWTLLARTYAAMQRFPESSAAYAKAVALAPQDAQLLTDHADVLAVLQGQKLAGEPARLVAQALVLDPTNLKALALAGSGAFEAQDYAKALGYWTRARELAPPGSDFANGLDSSIEAARKALPPGTQVAAAVTASASAAAVTAVPTPTAAPASTAAFTAATSPRTKTATLPEPIFSQPTSSTLAALSIASVASNCDTRPFVSIIPSACCDIKIGV
jgi:cytochrome c-type biogenesis protein CcmH